MKNLVAIESNPAAGRLGLLHRLLDDSLALAPEYDIGMASHLPMALAALDGLGADEARMRAFHAHYVRRFPARPPLPHAVPASRGEAGRGWKALRGRIEAFDDLRAHFTASLVEDGQDAVLRDALPALMDGAAGAAFHGPIRVAHAVESGHAGELAAALAYAAARWQPLPAPATARARFTDPAAWLDALDARRRQVEPAWRPCAPLISERMQQAARTTAYAELAGALDVGAGSLAGLLGALARACAARYAATANFTVLHMATATRAAQVLSPWLPPDSAAWAAVLHAVAAASLSACAAIRPVRPDITHLPLDWVDVRRLACVSDDDHVIKLVHAMAMQNERAPDAVWLAAARTAVRAELAEVAGKAA